MPESSIYSHDSHPGGAARAVSVVMRRNGAYLRPFRPAIVAAPRPHPSGTDDCGCHSHHVRAGRSRQDESGGWQGGRIRFRPEFVPGAQMGTPNATTWKLLGLSANPLSSGQAGPSIQFFIGVDGLNIWLVALSSLMMIPAILVSWDSIRERTGVFYCLLFLLQGAMVGAFLSFDVILFYVFFELTLIPTFFLIGRWGTGSGRRDAARKFFLYTLAGSLLTLLGIIGIVLTNPSPHYRADHFLDSRT